MKMNQFAWVTDVHLDKLKENDYREYKEYLMELNPELLVISGDISEGEKVYQTLKDFDETFNFPIYFVLGNHDFYWNSFVGVENNIRNLVKDSKNLKWLTESDVISLTENTAIIGVEGWGDGKNGTLNLSEGSARDLMTIEDYKGLNREQIAKLLNSRGDYYAEKLQTKLKETVKNYQKVILVTHVPPFIEVCFDRNLRICGEFKLPFYSCKKIGDMLLDEMSANPNCEMIVLCGHTHEKADVKILENLRVRVKESGYGTWWDATMINLD